MPSPLCPPSLRLRAYRRRRLLDRLDGIDGVHGQVAHGRGKATLCVFVRRVPCVSPSPPPCPPLEEARTAIIMSKVLSLWLTSALRAGGGGMALTAVLEGTGLRACTPAPNQHAAKARTATARGNRSSFIIVLERGLPWQKGETDRQRQRTSGML